MLYGHFADKLPDWRASNAWLLEVCKITEKLISGDVVEMGDTLVLETSAFAHESSNLSIPTKP